MARAAGHARRQAARAGLLAVGLAACAVIQEPPGGPPDFTPPVIVSVTPDSGAEVPDQHDPLVFRFDEVISEQSGGGLAKLIELSPRDSQVNVDWKRTGIAVRPKDGWRRGIVYQVTLLPGVADLRNNRLQEGRTVVFSTGGPIPDTRLTGTVVDWEDGRAGRGALVEAALLPDSLVYLGLADSVGDFALEQIPRGTYLVTATVDANNDRRSEPREPRDTATIMLDSSATHVFWAFSRDTVGPSLQRVTSLDSTTIRLEFAQKLLPGMPDTTQVSVWLLPDTVPVTVLEVWDQPTYDSLSAARRTAAADSARAQADTAQAQADTTRPPAAAAPPARQRPAAAAVPPARQPPAAADTGGAQPDTSRMQQLLASRPPLLASWVARLGVTLEPGGRYLVRARAENPDSIEATSRSVLAMPAPKDST